MLYRCGIRRRVCKETLVWFGWHYRTSDQQWRSERKMINLIYLHGIKTPRSEVAQFEVCFWIHELHTEQTGVVTEEHWIQVTDKAQHFLNKISLHFLFLKHVGHPVLVISNCRLFVSTCVVRFGVSLQVALFQPSGIRYPFQHLDDSRDYRPRGLHGQINTLDSGAGQLVTRLRGDYEETAPVWKSYNTSADDAWPVSVVNCDFSWDYNYWDKVGVI